MEDPRNPAGHQIDAEDQNRLVKHWTSLLSQYSLDWCFVAGIIYGIVRCWSD